MIVYFLVLTFFTSGYNSAPITAVTIPQTYQSKEACEAAGIEAAKDYLGRGRQYATVNFTCVPWNQEGD